MEIDLSKAVIDGAPVVEAEPVVETEEVVEESSTEEVETPEVTETPEEVSEVTEEPAAEEPAPETPEEERTDILSELGFENKESLEERLSKLTELEELLGDDDYIKGLATYRKENGNVQPYLDAFADTSNLSDLDWIRRSFDTDNADLTAEERDLLFSEEIQKYAIGDTEEYSDGDKQKGLIKLKRDAAKIKKSSEENRQKFKMPEPKAPKTKEEIAAERQAEYDSFKKDFSANSEIAGLLKDKQIKLEFEKGEPLVLDVANPELAVDVAYDMSKAEQFFVKDGKVDLQKWNMFIAMATDTEAFVKSIYNHGKSSSLTEIEEEIENPQKTNKTLTDAKPNTDTKEGFLSAALKTKKVRN